MPPLRTRDVRSKRNTGEPGLDPEQVGVLRTDQRRLDGLRAGDHRVAVALGEQVVERRGPRGPRRSGPARRSAGTCRSSTAIGSSSASRSRRTCSTSVCGGTPSRPASIIPAGDRRASIVRLPGTQPAGAHVGGERRRRQPLRDLLTGDERARATAPDQPTVAHQPVDHAAQRHPGDPELPGQVALGRQRLAGRPAPAISDSRLLTDQLLLARGAALLHRGHGPLVQHCRSVRQRAGPAPDLTGHRRVDPSGSPGRPGPARSRRT